MQVTLELMESAANLRTNQNMQHLLDALKQDRENRVSELVQSSTKTEYERAIIAGHIQQIDSFVAFIETATTDNVRKFRTQ